MLREGARPAGGRGGAARRRGGLRAVPLRARLLPPCGRRREGSACGGTAEWGGGGKGRSPRPLAGEGRAGRPGETTARNGE